MKKHHRAAHFEVPPVEFLYYKLRLDKKVYYM